MSTLEQQRTLLEELQTIESQISLRLQRNPELYSKYNTEDVKSVAHRIFKNKKSRGYKHNLIQSTEMKRMIDRYFQLSTELKQLQTNQPSEEEIKFDLNEFDRFFSELDSASDTKPFRSYYSMKSNFSNILSEFASDLNIADLFSGEESLGQYLDLLEHYEEWLNLDSEKGSYIKYLDIVSQFDKYQLIKGRDERNIEYLNYLKGLLAYLVGFVRRALPLFDIDGWLKDHADPVDAHAKEEQVDSLHCKYCRKTFAKDTVYQGHLSGKKHLKSVENYNKHNKSNEKNYKHYEHQIHQILTQILSSHLSTTRLNTERKRHLTEREKQAELAQLEKDEPFSDIDSDSEQKSLFDDLTNAANDEDSDDEEYYNNNPQNLPLGPDGQPIPYWLYRLQGLGLQHTCEICGNFTYKGRKTFETHFFNARHQHGLKCLGIEWSKVFKDITKIDEAVKLWDRLSSGKRGEELSKENSKQVEDEEGNVMSEKVYNDLKNQGLI
ncbi:hypothetical protein WICPIJ_001372 [Wickerhamomyces pijperi]|uniref:Matrin-type domain-containing protein n=1 Tax=Wickerhamomyces pijperi TaxID=599730 RepID=A0A9P8QDQ9_WICPI|nr:hypothetical protein WICPIJ_001372 [Wickerhamomyces pijperi]